MVWEGLRGNSDPYPDALFRPPVIGRARRPGNSIVSNKTRPAPQWDSLSPPSDQANSNSIPDLPP